MRRLWLLAALAVMTAGCSGGSTDTTSSSVATTEAATSTSAPAVTTAATPAPSTTAAATTTAPPAVAPVAALADSLSDVAELAVSIEGTTRPKISWTGGNAATGYIVVVTDDDGGVIWAWGGEADSVTVGSGGIDRDGVGAVLSRPGWVQVIGYSDDAGIVAASQPVPVG